MICLLNRLALSVFLIYFSYRPSTKPTKTQPFWNDEYIERLYFDTLSRDRRECEHGPFFFVPSVTKMEVGRTDIILAECIDLSLLCYPVLTIMGIRRDLFTDAVWFYYTFWLIQHMMWRTILMRPM
jgi:hypothetical protein